jgi:dephospho-CoA kinase
MKTFIEFIEETEDIPLDEAVLTFGKKLYPRDGNIVIMAGGAGSGKGFVSNRLLGIEGKVLDTDHVKDLAMKSMMVQELAKKKFGRDISKFNLRHPKDVTDLHEIISELGINDKITKALMTSIYTSNIKPNLIFDVTLKDMTKFNNIMTKVERLGYDKKNIHIVWVINDYETAKQQNLCRKRVVPVMIMKDTHRGAARTMKEIVNMGESLRTYMDGDIWFVFNKPYEDTKLASSDHGGSYVESANYIKIKEAGKSVKPMKELDKELLNKIKQYTTIK